MPQQRTNMYKQMNTLPTYDNVNAVYESMELPEVDDELLSHKKEQLVFMIINLLRAKPAIFNQQISNIKTKCELRQKPKSLQFNAEDVEGAILML